MRSLVFSLFIIPPMVAHGFSWNGFYLGGGVGASFLSAKRTVGFKDDAITVTEYFSENESKSGSGFDNQFVAGWRSATGSVLWGGECQLGYGLQEQKTQGSVPGMPDTSVVSKLSEKLHIALFGLVGKEISGWAVLFKFGSVGARFTHDFQTIQDGDVTEEQKVNSFSPGLSVGLAVEKPITDRWALRLDYTCAFHRKVMLNTRNSDDDTTIIQNANSLRNQSVMISAIWFLN